ncbi:hypothetical protein AB0K34_05065 [Actinomadura sp. NPDC049382]|uniref:hypothetical protein n=1 Tax=Actinomadura sp. NPDC049382 TaxID=3158220 RepID=UPI003442C6C4
MTAEGAHARAREAHIRALLHEHADRVVPGGGLLEIRARIARRPWWRRALAHLTASKTAAPGASGTADRTAVIYRKDTAMSHDLIEEGTPRGRQIAAALALGKLLESGPAEVAEWRIDDLGRLHGHVRRAHSDEQARTALDAFGEFLGGGVTPSQGRNNHAEWVHLSASGTYRGVLVNVWTHVGIRAIASPYSSFGGAR